MSRNRILPVSFEVYPPKRPEGLTGLQESIRTLDQANPDFISVTFGAGGSSTKDSLEVLSFIRDNSSATPLAHLTCVGTTKNQARALVESFLAEGITDFLALRGDLPEGSSEHHGELEHATDLIALIQESIGEPSGEEHIAVAAFPNGHPESKSLDHDIETLLAKQSLGATLAITQLFFFSSDYEHFVEKSRAAGVTIPILPGIMPVTSLGRLARVLELTGEKEPKGLASSLAACESAAQAHQLGIDWSANMVSELVEMGAPGIHLYAFNQHATVLSVLEQAGVR